MGAADRHTIAESVIRKWMIQNWAEGDVAALVKAGYLQKLLGPPSFAVRLVLMLVCEVRVVHCVHFWGRFLTALAVEQEKFYRLSSDEWPYCLNAERVTVAGLTSASMDEGAQKFKSVSDVLAVSQQLLVAVYSALKVSLCVVLLCFVAFDMDATGGKQRRGALAHQRFGFTAAGEVAYIELCGESKKPEPTFSIVFWWSLDIVTTKVCCAFDTQLNSSLLLTALYCSGRVAMCASSWSPMSSASCFGSTWSAHCTGVC
jgi:hypothetical protein